MIFINLKTYEAGTASQALQLIQLFETAAHQTGIKVIPVVQSSDIYEAVRISKLEIWAQSIDPYQFGAHTGATLPEAVFEDGAAGTFLNHSEHRFSSFADLKLAHQHAQQVGLKTLIFAANLAELKKVLALNPTFVSYEPPELVGSKRTSVAAAKPDTIAKATALSKEKGIPLIVGAGIKSQQDVTKSLELGAVGVAVASDVVAAKHPQQELLDLMEGFRQ